MTALVLESLTIKYRYSVAFFKIIYCLAKFIEIKMHPVKRMVCISKTTPQVGTNDNTGA